MVTGSSGAIWRWERHDHGIRFLAFDRPGSSQNVLDAASLDALATDLRWSNADIGARWIVLRGAKPGGFCAGADVKQLRACQGPAEVAAFLERGWTVLDRLANLAIPTVALIHGACLGGGLELALHCRYRLAIVGGEAPARLGTPEVKLGLIPGWGGIGLLPRVVGLSPALHLLLGGEPIDAEEAATMGLVDGLVASHRIQDDVARFLASPSSRRPPWPLMGWAEELAMARFGLDDPQAEHAQAKRLLLDVLATDLRDGPVQGRSATVAALSALAVSPEARAAMDAFLRRRGGGG